MNGDDPYAICPCCGERYLTFAEMLDEVCLTCREVVEWLIRPVAV